MTINQPKPDLYLSLPHACSYLADRSSTIVFVDPQCTLDAQLYASFVEQGFRRSGDLVYRPYCQTCSACIPVRITVDRFHPTRGQKRVWQRNRDISMHAVEPVFSPEHFDLYRRYQAARHSGSSMDDPDPQRYIGFLTSRQADTIFYEMRAPRLEGTGDAQGRLLGVAIIDLLPAGLSAVYTFFEPTLGARGLGIYGVLWQIAEAKRRGLPYLYLGYWIAETPKMAYKTQFHPLEALRNGRWQPLDLNQ